MLIYTTKISVYSEKLLICRASYGQQGPQKCNHLPEFCLLSKKLSKSTGLRRFVHLLIFSLCRISVGNCICQTIGCPLTFQIQQSTAAASHGYDMCTYFRIQSDCKKASASNYERSLPFSLIINAKKLIFGA